MATWPTIEDRNVEKPNTATLKATGTTQGYLDIMSTGLNVDIVETPGSVVKEGTPINAALFSQIKAYIDDLTAANATLITTIQNSLERTLVGTVSGTDVLTLPANFQKLEIRTAYTTPAGGDAVILANIPSWALSSTAIRPTFGYCANTTGASNGMLLNITNTHLHLEFLYDIGIDCTASCVTTVYAIGK